MEKIDASQFPLLVGAVFIWTGWRKSATPRRDVSLLVSHFGDEVASRLIPILKSLECEFYSSDAWKVAADLREIGDMAASRFKSKHPEIPNQIVQAFTEAPSEFVRGVEDQDRLEISR